MTKNNEKMKRKTILTLLVISNLLIITSVIPTCSSIDDSDDELYFEDVNILIIGRCRTIILEGTWVKSPYIGTLDHVEISVGDTWLEKVHILVYDESISKPYVSLTRLTDTRVGMLDAKGIFFWGCREQFSAGPIPPIIFIFCHADKFGISTDT